MTMWIFIFHIWLLDFHTLHFVLFLRIQHYIPHDDVSWHMDTYLPLWWHFYKLQLDNDGMDFMMRWQCQVVFLAASSYILDARSDLCFIFMKDQLYFSSSGTIYFIAHLHPPKGLWSYPNLMSCHTISSFRLGSWSASCIHDKSLSASSLHVFFHAFSLLSTLEYHLVIIGR